MPCSGCENAGCDGRARVRLSWTFTSELFGAIAASMDLCFTCAKSYNTHGRAMTWSLL